MSNIKALKQRIVSVIKTRKMTQAMKMVSAAKFKRAAKKSANIRAYSDGKQAVLTDLISRIEPDFMPTLFLDNKVGKEVIIIITSDRGLCGGFNNSVIRSAEKYLKSVSVDTQLILFGKKACSYFKNKNWEIIGKYPYFLQDINYEKVELALDEIITNFKNKKIGKVLLFHNLFTRGLSSELVCKQLLPIEINENVSSKEAGEALKSDYIYEPSKEKVVSEFLNQYLVITVFQAFLDSNTGEEAARMSSMDAATTNADEMISALSIKYNRVRQAAITREITEIVSGVEALAN
jgi:F-type H+-transporting ATPase subunit gamma